MNQTEIEALQKAQQNFEKEIVELRGELEESKKNLEEKEKGIKKRKEKLDAFSMHTQESEQDAQDEEISVAEVSMEMETTTEKVGENLDTSTGNVSLSFEQFPQNPLLISSPEVLSSQEQNEKIRIELEQVKSELEEARLKLSEKESMAELVSKDASEREVEMEKKFREKEASLSKKHTEQFNKVHEHLESLKSQQKEKVSKFKKLKETLLSDLNERYSKVLDVQDVLEEAKNKFKLLLSSTNLNKLLHKSAVLEKNISQINEARHQLIRQNQGLKVKLDLQVGIKKSFFCNFFLLQYFLRRSRFRSKRKGLQSWRS